MATSVGGLFSFQNQACNVGSPPPRLNQGTERRQTIQKNPGNVLTWFAERVSK
jgi:hypothetical protein